MNTALNVGRSILAPLFSAHAAKGNTNGQLSHNGNCPCVLCDIRFEKWLAEKMRKGEKVG